MEHVFLVSYANFTTSLLLFSYFVISVRKYHMLMRIPINVVFVAVVIKFQIYFRAAYIIRNNALL